MNFQVAMQNYRIFPQKVWTGEGRCLLSCAKKLLNWIGRLLENSFWSCRCPFLLSHRTLHKREGETQGCSGRGSLYLEGGIVNVTSGWGGSEFQATWRRCGRRASCTCRTAHPHRAIDVIGRQRETLIALLRMLANAWVPLSKVALKYMFASG